MDDREKVVSLLMETAEYFKGCRQNASLGSNAEKHFWELQYAASEAAEMLKGQETRIMSREEIENADGYFWFEDKAQKVMQARYFRKGILFEIGQLPFATKKLNWKTYGTLWRYWTAMPTDEQRKAVKWDAAD